MQKIYHYCDVEAFFSILTNRKLWLSGAHNLNDHQEIDWTFKKIHLALNRFEEKFSIEHIKELWSQLQQNRATPYVCSFSSEGDLLSQWRAYARDGTGISIGFDVDALPNSGLLPYLSASIEKSITTMPVIYEESEQDKFIELSILSCLSATKGKLAEEALPIITSAAYAINGQSTIYKNPAFAEEKEWRIVHMPLITANLETYETKVQAAISKMRHRVSSCRLVTYFEYDLASTPAKPPIVELVLGPKCQVSDYDLRLFLTSNGYQRLPHRRSIATYR